nr:unnamed protein product [Spirometra erinaceieuropaei]
MMYHVDPEKEGAIFIAVNESIKTEQPIPNSKFHLDEFFEIIEDSVAGIAESSNVRPNLLLSQMMGSSKNSKRQVNKAIVLDIVSSSSRMSTL